MATEVRRRKGAGAEFEIVEADDRKVLRHADAAALAFEERAEGEIVVAAEERLEVGARAQSSPNSSAPSATVEAAASRDQSVGVDAGFVHRV